LIIYQIPSDPEMRSRQIVEQFELSTIGFAQLSRNIQAEPRPARMRREERLEHMLPNIFTDAFTVVSDMQFKGPGIAKAKLDLHTASHAATVAQAVADDVP
jgi:hypothetical protein